MMAPTPLQWDSPKVVTLNNLPKVLIAFRSKDETCQKKKRETKVGSVAGAVTFRFANVSHYRFDFLICYRKPQRYCPVDVCKSYTALSFA